jgi:4-amino-4-deoxy-L-arabinose transferase-like glycosyltransferase
VYHPGVLSRSFANRAAETAVLTCILIVAAGVRLWLASAGVPYAVGIDEPQVVDRALRILHTGDWNPHLFDYPTLVIYFHAILAIGRYLWGAVEGEWRSLDTFDIRAIYTTGRVAAAMIGVATVWMTHRLGRELGSRRVGLLGAAQLAVHPMHVRESHFILTDVPVTALTTLTVWLAVRAGRRRTVPAYAWAGVAAGLAAAAKYNGAIAFIAVAIVWVLCDRHARDRWRKAAAAVAGASAAFLLGAPYTVLDLPSFLNGFAAQFSRFAGPLRTGDASWLLYVKHLSLAGRFWLPLAVLGAAIVCARARPRVRWLPLLAFVAAYYYVLASHALVFGRYALPLLPVLCLVAAVPAVELVRVSTRVPALAHPRAAQGVLLAVSILMTVPFASGTVRWLRDLRRPDTRTLAAAWMREQLPPGSTVAVENNGPTYLGTAGFRLLSTELLVDHPVDWYRHQGGYLIISSPDVERYGDYLGAGSLVYQIAPTPQRWGPPIRIVKLMAGSP